ncbi:hypothetical protein J1N35_038009 [Gossypium stocksii]|uniref:Uncharacterized protein n=1 Tax=Gossypium stocksii TaxID=47602 RepID=A0A9D3ZMG3_9ROSI|nr:hypothetical protein J1N35_038009 [Gossypium stocksii]
MEERKINSGEIPDAVLEVLARSTAFYLDHHLNIIRLSDKEGVEVVFPCLEHLSIHYFRCLTCIWEDVLPEGSFAALRTLSLHACPKLPYVCSMLQFVPSLEELLVDDCEAADEWQTKVLFEYITVYDCPQLKQIETAIGSDFEAIFKEVEE